MNLSQHNQVMSLSGSETDTRPIFQKRRLEAPQDGVRPGVTGCKDEKQQRKVLRGHVCVGLCHRDLGVAGRWLEVAPVQRLHVRYVNIHHINKAGLVLVGTVLSISTYKWGKADAQSEKVINIDSSACQGKSDGAILSLRLVCGRAVKMFTSCPANNKMTKANSTVTHSTTWKSLQENNGDYCEWKCFFPQIITWRRPLLIPKWGNVNFIILFIYRKPLKVVGRSKSEWWILTVWISFPSDEDCVVIGCFEDIFNTKTDRFLRSESWIGGI